VLILTLLSMLLRRLSNPTNFTKMGLWTLGGGGQDSSPAQATSSQSQTSDTSVTGGTSDTVSSSNAATMTAPSSLSTTSSSSSSSTTTTKDRGNPIAGMLQKELGISPAQGRKILDQRQKVQTVCSNLKEVRKMLFMG
jgi:hypothetical protein